MLGCHLWRVFSGAFGLAWGGRERTLTTSSVHHVDQPRGGSAKDTPPIEAPLAYASAAVQKKTTYNICMAVSQESLGALGVGTVR